MPNWSSKFVKNLTSQSTRVPRKASQVIPTKILFMGLMDLVDISLSTFQSRSLIILTLKSKLLLTSYQRLPKSTRMRLLLFVLLPYLTQLFQFSKIPHLLLTLKILQSQVAHIQPKETLITFVLNLISSKILKLPRLCLTLSRI